MHIGAGEIALLLALALVLFGAKRLPQVGKAAGDAIREFKSALYGKPKNDDEGDAKSGAGLTGNGGDAPKQ